MSNEKIADRIRKLLELARRGGTQAEAETAAAQAARLMAKHNLDHADLGHKDDDAIDVENPRVIYIVEGRSTMPTWIQNLSKELSTLCGCFCWKHYVPGEWVRVEAVGRERDLDIFAALHPALVHTIKKLTAKKQREAKARGLRLSPTSYAKGLMWGIVRRMRDAQNRVMDEVTRTSRTALRPVDWSKKAEEAIHKHRDEFRKAQKSRAIDVRSAAVGFRDAKSVKVPGEHAAIAGRVALGDGRDA